MIHDIYFVFSYIRRDGPRVQGLSLLNICVHLHCILPDINYYIISRFHVFFYSVLFSLTKKVNRTFYWCPPKHNPVTSFPLFTCLPLPKSLQGSYGRHSVSVPPTTWQSVETHGLSTDRTSPPHSSLPYISPSFVLGSTTSRDLRCLRWRESSFRTFSNSSPHFGLDTLVVYPGEESRTIVNSGHVLDGFIFSVVEFHTFRLFSFQKFLFYPSHIWRSSVSGIFHFVSMYIFDSPFLLPPVVFFFW